MAPSTFLNEVGDLMYYIYRQNNSGGYLIENDDVGSYVVVEATSQSKAQSKMEEIIVGYNDFCTCCGERWSPEAPKEINSMEEFTTVMWKRNFSENKYIIYHADGTKTIHAISGE